MELLGQVVKNLRYRSWNGIDTSFRTPAIPGWPCWGVRLLCWFSPGREDELCSLSRYSLGSGIYCCRRLSTRLDVAILTVSLDVAAPGDPPEDLGLRGGVADPPLTFLVTVDTTLVPSKGEWQWLVSEPSPLWFCSDTFPLNKRAGTHRPEGGSSCVERHRLLRSWGLLSNCSSEAADSCVWLRTGPNAVVLGGPELWQTKKVEVSNRWDPLSSLRVVSISESSLRVVSISESSLRVVSMSDQHTWNNGCSYCCIDIKRLEPLYMYACTVLLQTYVQTLLFKLLSSYSQTTLKLLSSYSQTTFKLLSDYFQTTLKLLWSYSQTTLKLLSLIETTLKPLSNYSQTTLKLLWNYSYSLKLLSSYSQATLKLLSNYSQATLKQLSSYSQTTHLLKLLLSYSQAALKLLSLIETTLTHWNYSQAALELLSNYSQATLKLLLLIETTLKLLSSYSQTTLKLLSNYSLIETTLKLLSSCSQTTLTHWNYSQATLKLLSNYSQATLKLLSNNSQATLKLLTHWNYSQVTLKLLSNYSQATLKLLSNYSQSILKLLSSYSQTTLKLLSSYSQTTLKLLSIYSQSTFNLLSNNSQSTLNYSQATLKLLSSYSQTTLTHLKLLSKDEVKHSFFVFCSTSTISGAVLLWTLSVCAPHRSETCPWAYMYDKTHALEFVYSVYYSSVATSLVWSAFGFQVTSYRPSACVCLDFIHMYIYVDFIGRHLLRLAPHCTTFN